MPFDEKLIDSNEQDTESNATIVAPTQSTVERVNVSLGNNVCIGDPLVVLTAMKMEVSKTYFLLIIYLCNF